MKMILQFNQSSHCRENHEVFDLQFRIVYQWCLGCVLHEPIMLWLTIIGNASSQISAVT
jgi:hypothetical protein